MNDRKMTELAGLLDDEFIVRAAGTVGSKEKSMKKGSVLKTALIAAALCLALAGTVFAVTAAVRQAKIYAFDTPQEAADAAKAASDSVGGEDVAPGMWHITEHGRKIADFEEPEPIGLEKRLTQYDLVLAHRFGSTEDGWNEMYTARKDTSYGLIRDFQQDTRYVADSLAGVEFLWPENVPALDFSRLESEYRAVAGNETFFERLDRNGAEMVVLSGTYRGEGDAIFSVELSYYPGRKARDQYMVSEDLTEYTTADGVVVAIDEDVTVSGRQAFWVYFDCGELSFSVYGNELPAGELHTLLDSFGLSALL